MSLTARGLVLMVVLAVLGIAAEWLPWPDAPLLWRMIALVALLVIARDAWRAHRRPVTVRVPGRIVLPLGSERTVTLAVTSPEPTVLELRPRLPPGIVADESIRRIELGPGQPAALTPQCRALRLGEHGWPAIPVRVRGPLALVWWRRDLPLGATVRVVPDSALRERRQSLVRGPGARLRPVSGSGSEILQLRPYRQGDPRRSIDWKATARSGRMISRDFTIEQHREIVILIDSGRTSAVEFDGLSRLGHFANLASQMIRAAESDDDPVGLIAFAGRPLAVHGPARRAAVRLQNTLATLTPRMEESNPIAAVLELGAMIRHRALLLLLTDLDDAAAMGQMTEAARLVLPRHMLVVADLWSADVASLAQAGARTWTDPYASLAAQEYQAAVRRNCAVLRRLGCRTILAPPASAGAMLAHTYENLKLSHRI